MPSCRVGGMIKEPMNMHPHSKHIEAKKLDEQQTSIPPSHYDKNIFSSSN
ncbi:predicted protein [Botrytis cinerea T4]|uniref:Uncharacterized protein n=1 Tax=Botryotinia fuckeliana (strain T4) TaxID=999810 RepID=G2Y3H8_BOTF4|nr:predicted protein [Botrytis cinerea T4]